jgi:hypothetical protein
MIRRGIDNISAELLIHGGLDREQMMTKIYQKIWTTKLWPKEWTPYQIIPIPKKGTKNYVRTTESSVLLVTQEK